MSRGVWWTRWRRSWPWAWARRRTWTGHRGGFGGFDGPPFGKRRSRRRRGDVRSAILLLLAEEPRNGYQLIQEIAQRSNNTWRPSSGSVYPALQQLEDEALMRLEVSEDGSKTCHLTDAGSKAAEAIEERTPWIDEDASESAGEALGQLVRQVAMAAMQVAQAGTEQQTAHAQKLLKDVRRSLYRILAEDDDADGNDD